MDFVLPLVKFDVLMSVYSQVFPKHLVRKKYWTSLYENVGTALYEGCKQYPSPQSYCQFPIAADVGSPVAQKAFIS